MGAIAGQEGNVLQSSLLALWWLEKYGLKENAQFALGILSRQFLKKGMRHRFEEKKRNKERRDE